MCHEEDEDAHLEAETENVFLIAFGKRQRVEHVPQHGVVVLHNTGDIYRELVGGIIGVHTLMLTGLIKLKAISNSFNIQQADDANSTYLYNEEKEGKRERLKRVLVRGSPVRVLG